MGEVGALAAMIESDNDYLNTYCKGHAHLRCRPLDVAVPTETTRVAPA